MLLWHGKDEARVNHHYEYLTREKRIPLTSLCHFGIAEEVDNRCATDWQDELMVQLETELILHSLAKKLPSKEMRIIRMKLDGARNARYRQSRAYYFP